MSERALAPTQKQAAVRLTPAAGGFLQRRCACGNHAIGGECEECKKRTGLLQRASLYPRGRGNKNQGAVPPIVQEALRSPGQPLDAETLGFTERRFGHDFERMELPPSDYEKQANEYARRTMNSNDATTGPSKTAFDFSKVRVHTDGTADQSNRALDARAYTVGYHIFFRSGQYKPHSVRGRAVLAHELAHVEQQSRDSAIRNHVQRLGFFEQIGVFLGLIEGDFSEDELIRYLEKITRNKHIEDSYDSDNKARAIVRRWMRGQARFHLTAEQMVLLIREMDTGFVGAEDQTGIFDILSHAENGDLRIIFGPGGISARQLESDFGGERKRRLLLFYDARFRGGKAALYGGMVDPVGGPGPGTPRFDWDWSFFRERIDNPTYEVEELAAQITALPEAQRGQALKDVGEQRHVLEKAVNELTDKIAAEPDPAKKATLEGAQHDLKRRKQRYDAILQPAFRDIALAEPPATLLPQTRLPTAAEKIEIGKALKPELRVGAGGVPLPFQNHIPGEPTADDYDKQVPAYMPTMVAEYFTAMVAGKGPAEHADPAKIHKLDEFDSIANAAKDATDKIFGAYKSGPAFRSDRPPPVGRGQLHDLFADTQTRLAAMSPAAKQNMAKALLMYFFQNDSVIVGFNRHHNADPRFSAAGAPLNAEATILNTVADNWVSGTEHVRKLNEIDRNWDASADPSTHEVNIQIFKKSTPAEDRLFLWDMYQTLVHEYIHTLAHPDYVTFAEGFGPSQENTTLIEGVDSFLTEIVWSEAKAHTTDPTVRAQVEGAAYSGLPFDASVIPPVYSRRYASYAQAVRLVNVMGVRNLYAAYFLGKVDLIRIP
jgi:hypothetical protein